MENSGSAKPAKACFGGAAGECGRDHCQPDGALRQSDPGGLRKSAGEREVCCAEYDQHHGRPGKHCGGWRPAGAGTAC